MKFSPPPPLQTPKIRPLRYFRLGGVGISESLPAIRVVGGLMRLTGENHDQDVFWSSS